MNGWIKLHRRILQNPVVCKDSDHVAVWLYLLLNAAHTEIPFLFNGKKIILQKGQLVISAATISKLFLIDDNKIYRILNVLKSEEQITTQSTRHGTLITLLNWQIYQDNAEQNEEPVRNQCGTSEEPVRSNKKVRTKEGEECKKKDLKPLPVKSVYGSAELVKLTDAEYQKIILKAGSEKDAAELIDILGNYKGSKGKTYKDDYLTLLGWPLERLEELKTKRHGGAGPQQVFKGGKTDILGEIEKAQAFFGGER